MIKWGKNRRKWSEVLCLTLFLFIPFNLSPLSARPLNTDSVLLAAYQREDMTAWKEYLDTAFLSPLTPNPLTSNPLTPLIYEYGYCGYIVAEAKKEGKEALLTEAKHYVQHFKSHVEKFHSLPYREGTGVGLPVGHYEMYMSAVYVYELRLHESIHPLKAMSLAKKAVQLAPNDPLTLSYYGTCLFYAPKPIGSKQEALSYFEKAEVFFQDPKWKYCWIREANEMYIEQCKEKLKVKSGK